MSEIVFLFTDTDLAHAKVIKIHAPKKTVYSDARMHLKMYYFENSG